MFAPDAVEPTLLSPEGSPAEIDSWEPFVSAPLSEALAPAERTCRLTFSEKFDPQDPLQSELLAEAEALPTEEMRARAKSSIEKNWESRAQAALTHPYVRSLTPDVAPQAAELLVRYFNDPVFESTIHQRAVQHGGTTNLRQMVLAPASRELHQLDEYFGQCNETQGRTQKIFENFSTSWKQRFGENSVKLMGAPAVERSQVLLAYGLAGDARGDDHMFFAVRAKGVAAETMYFDPWVSQRADGASIYREGDYQKMRESWDSSRWYVTDFRSTR